MINHEEPDFDQIRGHLQNWFSDFSKVVVAGIGNPLRKDDFVGVRIVRDLRDKVTSAVHLIECETVPESSIEAIVKLRPSHILIIDAALLNLKPGSMRLVDCEELKEEQAVSTHALPLRIFCQYIMRTIEAKIALLVIQPRDTTFGEGLTQELEEAAKGLSDTLSRILSPTTD